MANDFETAYNVLNDIYRKGAYSTLALDNVAANDTVRRMVLGVLERDIELDFILGELVTSRPKPVVTLALKLGTYCLLYMRGIKPYATINETVELLKKSGKQQVASFANAVLRKVAAREFSLPTPGSPNYLSVKYNRPQWLVDLVLSEYDEESAQIILSSESTSKVHFRLNARYPNATNVLQALQDSGEAATRTAVGGYLSLMCSILRDAFRSGMITYQGASSMFAVQAAAIKDGDVVLDACSAPGGKSVYASEFTPKGKVVACDVYPHRLGLIQGYAERMRANNVEVRVQDATAYLNEFDSKFDVVLVDAPCSGLGTLSSKPDILLNKTPADIKALAEIQLAALSNSSRYVKPRGTLVYSTCSVARMENGDVVRAFLKEHGDFSLSRIVCERENDGEIQILPQNEYDGFYVARLVRNDG